MKLKKGDEVVVISGKDIGKKGTVTRVYPTRDKVIVTGSAVGSEKSKINVVRKHTKPKGATMQGGIIDKEMPLHVSNVALLCSKCGPTRIGYRFNSDGRKVRVCRKCGADS